MCLLEQILILDKVDQLLTTLPPRTAMSQLLLSDLSSLSSESKRKHPEVRTAAETALSALKSNPDGTINSTRSTSDDTLLRPILLGCETKNSKVISISVGILLRLVGMKVLNDVSSERKMD